MSTKPNNAAVVDVCNKRLQALKSYVASKGQISMNGTKSKLSDVVAIYQGCLDTGTSLATKRSEVKIALTAHRSANSARRSADKALKAWVIAEYGADSQQAIDFGFPPPTPVVRKASNKANAAALAMATRKARNTMGPKQRLSIKGTLPVPTAPAAPATNPPAGASPASAQPVTIVVQTTPSQQPQTQTTNGAPAPAAVATAAPAQH
jgi:hypothetical protein